MGEALHLFMTPSLPPGQIVAEFSGRAHFHDWSEEASGKGRAKGRRTGI